MGSAESKLTAENKGIKQCRAAVGTFLDRLLPTFRKPPTTALDLNDAAVARRKPLSVLIQEAQLELGLNVHDNVNIAVVGVSGVGKSSFINGVTLCRHRLPGSAQVGVTECTDSVRSFPHPIVPHIVFWDLPGGATQLHPASSYFNDMKLYAFDCIFIVTSDRFLALDLEVASSAFFHKRPCAFIRSKADISVEAVARREEMKMVEASKLLRESVQQSFERELKSRGFVDGQERQPLFLICSDAFTNDKAYFRWDEKTNVVDKSLDMLDELKIFDFLAEVVRVRQPTVEGSVGRGASTSM